MSVKSYLKSLSGQYDSNRSGGKPKRKPKAPAEPARSSAGTAKPRVKPSTRTQTASDLAAGKPDSYARKAAVSVTTLPPPGSRFDSPEQKKKYTKTVKGDSATPAKAPGSKKESAPKKKGPSEFEKAFASARKSGAKEFEFKGKKYNTKLKK